jgi:hypothetical protein
MISTCFLSPLYLSQSHPSNITIPLSLLHVEGNGVYIQKQFVAAFSVLFITYKYTSEQKLSFVLYLGYLLWNSYSAIYVELSEQGAHKAGIGGNRVWQYKQ